MSSARRETGESPGPAPPGEGCAWRIRPMRADDIAEVVAIERVSFTLPWSEAAFRRELTEIDNSHLLVVEAASGEGGVLAYACWWEVTDECHITNFAVAPAVRGRGIARFLLEGMLAEARACGVLRATLEVRSGNAAAIALYENAGFTAAAMRPRYYPDNQEDALIMWKERI